MTAATPPILVLDDRAVVATTARRLRSSGHRVQDGFALPPDPFDLASERLLCAGVVDTADAAGAAVLGAVRGCGLLVSVAADDPVRERFLRDVAKVGPVTMRVAAPGAAAASAALTVDQRELLAALGAGATIPEAARELFISVRTAERRVGEARKVLGVRTTAEAVAALAGSGEAADDLPSVPWARR